MYEVGDVVGATVKPYIFEELNPTDWGDL